MKKSTVIMSVIVFTIIVFLITSVPLYAQQKTVRLRYSNFFPPNHPISKLSEEWCAEIDKKTNGRVKITHFPGGTLTPPTQTYDSVVKGIADIGQSLLSYSPGRLPLSEVLQSPLGYTSGYQATKLANEFFRKFRPKEFDDVEVMYIHGGDHTRFFTRKPVTSIADIKGLRIIANPQSAFIVKALGADPLTISITDTYDALQRGMADGTLMTIEALKGWKIAEVTNYTIDNHAVSYNAAIYVIMNKNKWKSISREDQQIIKGINEDWIERQGKLWNQLDKEAIEYAIQRGHKFVKPSGEELAQTAKKMQSVNSRYLDYMKTKGLPGEEALNFCLDYIKTHP